MPRLSREARERRDDKLREWYRDVPLDAQCDCVHCRREGRAGEVVWSDLFNDLSREVGELGISSRTFPGTEMGRL